MLGKHRVNASGGCKIALQNRIAQPLVAAVGTKRLELTVEVEHHRWCFEAPRKAAGAWVKTYDEKPLSAEAHCEMGVVRIVRNPRIGALAEPLVLVAQRLEAAP